MNGWATSQVSQQVAEWRGHQSASGLECQLDGGYHQSACLEVDVGSVHHYQWRGGAHNKVEGQLKTINNG